MAKFLHKLPFRKNVIHFLTVGIFPYGNFFGIVLPLVDSGFPVAKKEEVSSRILVIYNSTLSREELLSVLTKISICCIS